MRFFHIIVLIVLLLAQCDSLTFASTVINDVCQFDKSAMVKEKLKKAQKCINNGNFKSAKNYLYAALKLDPNNANAKLLLVDCNNCENNHNGSDDQSITSDYSKNNPSDSEFSVSNNHLYFNNSGGQEAISVGGDFWFVSVSPTSWVHITEYAHGIVINVEKNTNQFDRNDYFKLQSGDKKIRIDITQKGSKAEGVGSSSKSNYNRTYPSNGAFSVSNTNLFFNRNGEIKQIRVKGQSWFIKVHPATWVHISHSDNIISLTVDKNYSGTRRSYFIIQSGEKTIRIDITQWK